MNLPATYNKEKNERAKVKVYKKEERKLKQETKLEGLKISTKNTSEVRSLSQKLRDIDPVKPRTYYKALGELNSGNMSSMKFKATELEKILKIDPESPMIRNLRQLNDSKVDVDKVSVERV